MLDVVGTTVLEKDTDIVLRCFRQAFSEMGLHQVTDELLRQQRGKEKSAAIKDLIQQYETDAGLADDILRKFETNFAAAISSFEEMPGLPEAVASMREKGMSIGLGSGLSSDMFTLLYQHLHFARYNFDFIATAGDKYRGRPYPDMILAMMDALHEQGKSAVLKIGDTVTDVEEGKNAGVLTGVILSGTQPGWKLEAAEPDFVFSNLFAFADWIKYKCDNAGATTG